ATGRNQGLKFVEKLSRASYPHRSGAGPQAVGRASPFGIARSRAQTKPGWPSEPVWDRSVQSTNKTWLAERARLGSLGPEHKQNSVGRASPFGIARSRAQTKLGWPSEPVWDRSVQSTNKTRLAERARLGSLGPEHKQNSVGRASPFGIARS